VEGAAESITSLDVEVVELVWFADWRGGVAVVVLRRVVCGGVGVRCRTI
jgi:hypothetical protein